MAEGPRQSNDKSIEAFENSNLLRYTHKTGCQDYSVSGRFSGLEFTEELSAGTTKRRKISKLPCKVLDAPALQDDYYLNLIDWGSQNLLAVGLGSSVYIWNANNSKVSKLCDLGISDSATSVSWSPKGPHFALGTNSG
jgi:cell division cycle 20-like protein 1 (cofactor of APC complex)